MELISTLGLALALAADAFAVSVAGSCALPRLRWPQALKVALFFGGFQGAMPLLGYLAGQQVNTLIAGLDHWIAFGLLGLVGGRMIAESRKSESAGRADMLRLPVLLMLAVATSIDALAVGLSLACLRVPILRPAVLIALVAFLLSLVGMLLGRRLGGVLGKWASLFGGIVLIAIGVQILITHLA